MKITTQVELRRVFWLTHDFDSYYMPGLTQNQYPAEVREVWVNYVDLMCRNGSITEALAARATL
jgi:hypothetical protein